MSIQISPIPHSIFERAVLIDTSAICAVYDNTDWNHEAASDCLQQINEAGLSLHITTPTIFESHGRILRLGRQRGIELLQEMYEGSYTIERVIEDDEEQARRYLSDFQDQDISYVDALNWSVMLRRGISKAFTFDRRHYSLVQFIGFVVVPPLYL